jgi:tetratricopeptide (TPR) repeat protein
MALKIRCPKCQAILTIAEATPGLKVSCSNCQKVLVLRPSLPAVPRPLPARPSPGKGKSDEKVSPTAPARSSAAARKKGSLALKISLGALGASAVMALITFVVYQFSSEEKPPPIAQTKVPVVVRPAAPVVPPTKPASSKPVKKPPLSEDIIKQYLEAYEEPPKKTAGAEKAAPAPVPLQPAEPMPPGKLQPFLYLEKADIPTDFSPGATYPILGREVMRQAFYLAARHGLGLATRDGSLGESPPENLAPENSLFVDTIVRENSQIRLSLERGPSGGRKYIWKEEFPLAASIQLPTFVAKLEEISRVQLSQALAKAGFSGKPIPVKANAQVPEDVEHSINQMTFIAQFAALRRLHALLAADGESPQVQGALIRAYTNLGVLTECHGNAGSRVAKARALLYAQRLAVNEPKSPWSYWHRAYAFALCGLHRAALDDLREAERLVIAKKGNEERAAAPFAKPAWVDLIEAYCHFDTAKLEDLAANPSLSQLGHLLAFFTVDDSWAVNQTLTKARLVLEESPECYRVYDSISGIGGVASGHWTSLEGYITFGKTIRQRLKELPGLSQAAAHFLEIGATEADIYSELAKSGQTSRESSEPSWTWLANMCCEARFLQVYRRVHFMAFRWSVPVGDFLVEALPLLRDHPNRAYFERFQDEYKYNQAPAHKLLAELPLADISYHQMDIVIGLQSILPDVAMIHFKRLERMGDNTYQDLSMRTRYFTYNQVAAKNAFVKNVKALSPDSPLARIQSIRYDWGFAKDRAEAWEKDCQQASVLFELGKQYLALRHLPDAERCLKRCILLSPDIDIYKNLADVYKIQQKDELWRATLMDYLKEEDTALGHAMVRDTLAHYHMTRKEWQQALPLAEAAAESWAAFAMNTASACNEAVKDWERAELWIRRLTERYSEGFEWFIWCQRTGRGDSAAARDYAAQFYIEMGNPIPPKYFPKLAVYLTLTKQPDHAIERWKQAAAQDPKGPYGLFLALALDAQGDKAGRDAALRALLGKNNPYSYLSKSFADCLAQGEHGKLDFKAIEAALKRTPRDLNPDIDYFVGRFLDLRGEKEVALRLLKRSAVSLRNVVEPDKAWIGPVLASVLLRDRGIKLE